MKVKRLFVSWAYAVHNFKVGGGGGGVKHGAEDVRDGCAPFRSWGFFKNVVLNETIWCTVVKHLSPCLLHWGVFYFRTGWSKYWRDLWLPWSPPRSTAYVPGFVCPCPNKRGLLRYRRTFLLLLVSVNWELDNI